MHGGNNEVTLYRRVSEAEGFSKLTKFCSSFSFAKVLRHINFVFVFDCTWLATATFQYIYTFILEKRNHCPIGFNRM